MQVIHKIMGGRVQIYKRVLQWSVRPEIQPVSRGGSSSYASIPRVRNPRATSFRAPRMTPARSGPTYIYQCGVCQKKFRHSKPDPHLGKHKAPGGLQCSGRIGYLVETKY